MSRIINMATIALMLCTGGFAVAQIESGSEAQKASASTCIGTVVSVTDQKVVVQSDAGGTMEFSRDAYATSGWAQGIKAGDHVEVAYRSEADNLIATSVHAVGETSPVAQPADPMATKAPGAAPSGEARSALPQTGSDLPLLGLAGLAFFIAAYFMRRLRLNS
jgi:LPXTG-motif cell wall-anchored protein